MVKTGKKKFGRALQAVLVFVLVFMACPQVTMQAAPAKTKSALLRLISTTDLHGQVSTTHYDNASEKPGSLAQVYTLIKQARSEAGSKNTLTFDIGDSVYGYAADYILNHSGEDAVQPIYKAMSLINYDAVTLGNHDFDYGYKYIDKQLQLSGLKEKCVLSNVILTDTGKTAWNEKKMITKKVKAEDGKYVNLDIGIIGVTIPTMSTYSNCKEDLAPLPIVSTVKKQAAALKSDGADLIIVLAHSSFGPQNPTSESVNAVYGLTKLANVDAVVAGHGHKNFPSTDEGSAAFYALPNVDKKTSLVNGKPVTMVKDHGAGIGVIDLNLNIAANGKVTVEDAATGLRMVTKDTASSAAILESQQPEIGAVDSSLQDVVGSLADNEKISSYFALLEDNYAIQLVNESKIQHGLSYTGGEGKELYGSYPVVACTKYTLSGSNSAEDNISLNGSITMKDILNMQQDNHNNNILYVATGSQLRELLEWSASIYATSDGTITSDAVLGQLLESRGAASIAAADWIEDWSAFGVFDGIEYKIDAAQPPRYNKVGNLKNPSSHRIVSMSCNGQPVDDNQTFILVCHTLASNIDATGTIPDQKVLGKTELAYQQLAAYIKQQQEYGSISSSTDNNWEVVFDTNREYIVRSSVLSQADAVLKEWFRGLLSSNETFAYYLAQFIQTEGADTDKPLLVVAAASTAKTDQPVTIKVQASDSSGTLPVKWLAGQADAASSAWADAAVVEDGSFTVEENGVYSVLAEDLFHNQIVKYITVNNIDHSIVQAPTINRISNKGSVLTGKARYGTTVHIDAGGYTYEVEADADGTYTCTVERMATGKQVSAYCTDETGKMSEIVTETVYKNGPDVPLIDAYSNRSLKMTGTFTDASSTVVAIVDSDVYMSASDEELYRNSEVYASKRIINTVDYVQNGRNFELALPVQRAGKDVKIVALDKAGRKSATVSMLTADEAPDMPVVGDICNADLSIYGKVTNINESGTVSVSTGTSSYTAEIAQDGSFEVPVGSFTAGDTITVSANDVKGGIPRSSLATTVTVAHYSDYLDKGAASVNPIYDNSMEIKGQAQPGSSVYIRVRGSMLKATVDAAGQFTSALSEPLALDEYVYIVVRDAQGKIAQVLVPQVGKAEPVPVPEPGTQAPETPSVLTSDITLQTQQIEVLAKESGTIVMDVGGEVYMSSMGVFNQAYNGYVHTMYLPPATQEQAITIYFINTQGVSSGTVSVTRTSGTQQPGQNGQ